MILSILLHHRWLSSTVLVSSTESSTKPLNLENLSTLKFINGSSIEQTSSLSLLNLLKSTWLSRWKTYWSNLRDEMLGSSYRSRKWSVKLNAWCWSVSYCGLCLLSCHQINHLKSMPWQHRHPRSIILSLTFKKRNGWLTWQIWSLESPDSSLEHQPWEDMQSESGIMQKSSTVISEHITGRSHCFAMGRLQQSLPETSQRTLRITTSSRELWQESLRTSHDTISPILTFIVSSSG